MKLGGPNGNWIYLKKCILLNYGNSEDESIIYIEEFDKSIVVIISEIWKRINQGAGNNQYKQCGHIPF